MTNYDKSKSALKSGKRNRVKDCEQVMTNDKFFAGLRKSVYREKPLLYTLSTLFICHICHSLT